MLVADLAQPDLVVPSAPRGVALVVAELARPELSLRRLHQYLATDPGLVLRLLRMANAPTSPVRGEVSSVAEALALLGGQQVRDLAGQATSTAALRLGAALPLANFVRYSVNTAKVCRSFAGALKINPGLAYSAGLLHAVGELPLVAHMDSWPKRPELIERIGPLDPRRQKAEARALSLSYPEISAELLRQWGLPPLLVEAVAHHGAPLDSEVFEPLAAVLHLATWRTRALEANLSERQMATTFPDVVGLTLGMDIDMVLQQDPIDWHASQGASDLAPLKA